MVEDDLPQYSKRIDHCLLADRHALHRQLKRLTQEQKPALQADKQLARFIARLERSEAIVKARQTLKQEISFPDVLPMTERLDEVRSLIDAHQVIILCGETGSGKSTQLPKLCLSMGRGVFGRIGHTQPRRIAARSLAERVSSEIGQELGQTVGYKVRFHDQLSHQSRVKLMTDGILLAEIQNSPWLNEYDTLIIDEAHERSLNIDLILGYLKRLLARRKDLKVIITSATIDPGRFSSFFDQAPVIEVSGRTYPVELLYRGLKESDTSQTDALQQGILDAVDELTTLDPRGNGHILVFLSGEREIREAADSLRKHGLQMTEVLPLFARMGVAEQAKIFKPSGLRRIILATNVAETSLTIPGIHYVIDTGFARISRYSHRSKVQRLPVERISKASANQRKGRCGRIARGVCIRLYSEEDFEARSDFTEPEIQRTNLGSVILQMKLFGFGDIAEFPFVDAPDSRLVKDGYRLLRELSAIDGEGGISKLGQRIARLPVDPRIGRMLLEAGQTHCLKELLVIGAALSVQDSRDRPMDRQQAADEAHREFRHEASDFLSFLNLWRYLEEQRRHLSKRKFHTLCRTKFLSSTRVQEWHDIHHQLHVTLVEMGYRENQIDAGEDEIHRALLSGLLSHLGFKTDDRPGEYLGARQSRFFIFPGSGLFKKNPKWLMAAELVETSKLYARTVAVIQPEWVESLAGHLIKHSYSEPHWQKRRGQVGAYEKITLFGLVLTPRRQVNFGPIDPVQSREIFIRSALVDRDFQSKSAFWGHNEKLIAEVEALEAKSRRRDILVDQESLYQFYDARIPEGIYSSAQLESWLKTVSRQDLNILFLTEDDLIRQGSPGVAMDQYPDSTQISGVRLPLDYRFDPASGADGVTLQIPIEMLNQIPESRGEWLVPGLLQQRILGLLRGLPKALRKQLVPLPDTVERLMNQMTPSDQSLTQVLAAGIKRQFSLYIPENAWPMQSIDQHLQMNFRLLDAEGKVLAEDRDLSALKEKFSSASQQVFAGIQNTGLEQSGMTDWSCGDLPETIEIERTGMKLTAFPALADEGAGVAVKILNTREDAVRSHRLGLNRLIRLQLSKEIKALTKGIPGLDRMRLQYAKVSGPASADKKTTSKKTIRDDLADDLIALLIDALFLDHAEEVRDKASFDQRIRSHRGDLQTRAERVFQLVAQVLSEFQLLRKQLSTATQINWIASTRDITQQLDQLVYQGFLQQVQFDRLQHYPRYLKAMKLRLDKLPHAVSRDQQQMREMQKIADKWDQRCQPLQNKQDARLEEIRWMLEELRVSLFAQELKTAHPISVKRIERRWRELGL